MSFGHQLKERKKQIWNRSPTTITCLLSPRGRRRNGYGTGRKGKREGDWGEFGFTRRLLSPRDTTLKLGNMNKAVTLANSRITTRVSAKGGDKTILLNKTWSSL